MEEVLYDTVVMRRFAGLGIPTMPAGDSNRSRPLISTQAGHPSEGVERGWGYGFGAVRSVKSGVPRLRSDSPWSVIR